MISLVDTHCHLCAGLDDGPRSLDEAVEMCRVAYRAGTRWIAACAHQNEQYSEVTPERIREAVSQLRGELETARLPLALRPVGEVMVQIGILDSLADGRFLTVNGEGKYLLLEYPTRLYLDIRHVLEEMRRRGVRPILAHPERHSELLYDAGRIEQLIELGALVQVSAASLSNARPGKEARALKQWARRGIIHLVGSDGHSPTRRPPVMADAYRRLCDWAGAAAADRACGSNGLAVLQGLPLRLPPPEPVRRRRWFFFRRQ